MLVTGGERLADMFAQQIPVALLGFDAPSGPKIVPTANDGRTGWLKNNATILPPLRVFEPPIAKGRRVITAIVDDTIEVKVPKVTEGQECWHLIDVALASSFALVCFEAQYHGARTVEDDTIFGVHLVEQALRCWCRFLMGQQDSCVAN